MTTTELYIAADPDAPIACDMSTAADTPVERLAEYGRLFERSLLRRERRDDAVVFVLRAESESRKLAGELARREAACCPFLDYRLETVGDNLIWTVTGDDRAGVEVILDEFYALPEQPRP